MFVEIEPPCQEPGGFQSVWQRIHALKRTAADAMAADIPKILPQTGARSLWIPATSELCTKNIFHSATKLKRYRRGIGIFQRLLPSGSIWAREYLGGGAYLSACGKGTLRKFHSLLRRVDRLHRAKEIWAVVWHPSGDDLTSTRPCTVLPSKFHSHPQSVKTRFWRNASKIPAKTARSPWE